LDRLYDKYAVMRTFLVALSGFALFGREIVCRRHAVSRDIDNVPDGIIIIRDWVFSFPVYVAIVLFMLAGICNFFGVTVKPYLH
jgi:hypothetical protein